MSNELLTHNVHNVYSALTMKSTQTDEIVTQNETGQERPVTTIRVYKDTQDQLLELQLLAKRQTGTKPTQADIVELACALYKRELEKDS